LSGQWWFACVRVVEAVSRRKWYRLTFFVFVGAALVMAFVFDEPQEGLKIVAILSTYGIGMYFQGRWHESDEGEIYERSV
jgi:hypothetical protein